MSEKIGAISAPTLHHLSAEQQQVVQHLGSPAIVLAGAGSGKTHTLGYRIKWLIENGADPREILAVTFSKKAAEELEARIIQKLKINAVRIGTFHSVGYSLLREFIEFTPYKRGFSLMKDYQKKSFIVEFLKENSDIESSDWSEFVSQISAAKRDIMQYDDVLKSFGADTAKVFEYYEFRKAKENVIDYDDMIYWPALLIKTNTTVARETKARYKYGLIDEAQDNNKMQFQMAQHLVVPNGLMIIGDDYQSIYAFQGARPDLTIFDFMQKSGAKVFLLKDNYRSASVVVEAANKLSTLMDAPIKKEMNMKNKNIGSVSLFKAETADDEAQELIASIQFAKTPEMRWNDFAVLYRTNAQSRALEEVLISREIPYVIYGGYPFFSRKEVKDILAYIKLGTDPNKHSKEIGRVINIASANFPTRTRKLGKVFVDGLYKSKNVWPALQTQVNDNRVRDFLALISKIAAVKTPAEKVRVVLDMCYTKYVQQEQGMSKDSDDDTVSLLDEIREIFSKFDTCEKLFAHCAKMQSTAKDEEKRLEDAVQLMTVHKSKGLEWRNVAVIGLNERILPHAKADTPEGFAEERRIAYVAITRAIESLTVSYVSTHRNRLVNPSPFISEMGLDVAESEKAFSDKAQENKELQSSIFSGD